MSPVISVSVAAPFYLVPELSKTNVLKKRKNKNENEELNQFFWRRHNVFLKPENNKFNSNRSSAKIKRCKLHLFIKKELFTIICVSNGRESNTNRLFYEPNVRQSR